LSPNESDAIFAKDTSVASAAMTFSSVSVIGNALRLQRVPL
jgi:cation transport ATPase